MSSTYFRAALFYVLHRESVNGTLRRRNRKRAALQRRA